MVFTGKFHIFRQSQLLFFISSAGEDSGSMAIWTTSCLCDVKSSVLAFRKGQIAHPTLNTAPLICGACYSTQPGVLLTTASAVLILFHQCFHRQVQSPAGLPANALHSNKHSGHSHGPFR